MRVLRFCIILFLVACSAEKKGSEETTIEETNLVPKKESYSKEACQDEVCAKVEFSWPEFPDQGKGKLLNDAIQDQLLTYFYSDSVGNDLDQQAEIYLNQFRETQADFPDMPGGWAIEVKASVSFDSLNTISILFEEYNFSGGAHPNTSQYFMNYDRETGEFLSIDRLILDQPRLLELAEQAFRAKQEVDPQLSLADDGRFFLPETGFFLPNAMGFKGTKFHLIYLPYEIGPYAMGYTELEFEMEEVKGIVRM